MKHIITSIVLLDLNAQEPAPFALDIIPGAGTLTIDTSEDGQTREINLSQKIRRSPIFPEIVTADLQITVTWTDEENSAFGIMTFGSVELPARMQLGDDRVQTVTCRYTELI